MFLTSAMIALAADQPINADEPGELDIEPPVLKQNLSDELAEAGTPDGDVARCEKKLERAKRNAAGADRMWRIGVLAKVEVEQRALKVIKYEAELASARVVQAKEQSPSRNPALRPVKPRNKNWKWRKQRSLD